jgi:hypothetical protein
MERPRRLAAFFIRPRSMPRGIVIVHKAARQPWWAVLLIAIGARHTGAAGHGIPAPPHSRTGQGRCGWFSQTHPLSSQRMHFIPHPSPDYANVALVEAMSPPDACRHRCTFDKPICRRDHERMWSIRGERGKINIARRLASRAFDLKPWVTAIDRLIDSRAGIDGAAIGPHLFIPALTSQVIGFADQCLAQAPFFIRCLGNNLRHRPRLHKLLLESFAVTAGQAARDVLSEPCRPA